MGATINSLIEDHRFDPDPHPRLLAQIKQLIATATGGIAALALATTAPASLSYGGTASIGIGTTAARADHVHALPALPGATTSVPGIVRIAMPNEVAPGVPVASDDPRLVVNAIGGNLTATRIPYAASAHGLADDSLMTWDTVNKSLVLGPDPGGTARLRIGGDLQLNGVPTIDTGTGALPALGATARAVVSGPDGAGVRFALVGNGAGLAIDGWRANGTRGSKTSVTTNDDLLILAGRAYESVGAAYTVTAIQSVRATEPHTTLNKGTGYFFEATPNGSNARAVTLAVQNGQVQTLDGTVSLPGQSFINDTDTGWYRIGANNVGLALGGVKVLDFAAALVGVTDAVNLSFGTTTGTKIGTGTTQKLGFWNKTPVVQPAVPTYAAITTVATAGATYTATEQGMLATLKADVIALRAMIVALTNRFDQSVAAPGLLSGTAT